MSIWKWFVGLLAKQVAAEVESLTILEVARLSVGEGETLFVVVKGRPPAEELDRLHKRLCKATGLAGSNILIVSEQVAVFTVGKDFP